ncbi:MAG TPA: LppX_LprAFG lipoprotein [Thermomicrobiales bacterium]|nr:LppX_LprAFG lipoprotein [Thermomicrobiales bacterium]
MHEENWQHPLIRTTRRRMNRRLFLVGAGSAAVAVAMAGQGAAMGQDATPQVDVTGDEDAVKLLDASAKAMAALQTFHFDVETTRGESSAMGLNLKRISGDVRRPADFQAEVSVDVPFGSITVRAIGINGTFYIEDPFSQEGGWRTFSAGSDIMALVNPDIIILMAVRLLSNAKIDGSEKFNGTDAQRVVGEVDFQRVAGELGGDASGLADQLAQGPIPVTVWIDADNLILGMEIDGPLLAAESDAVVRLVSFSAFDEPVEIDAPDA